MSVSKSAYYSWSRNGHSFKSKPITEQLKDRIKELFDLNCGIYGSYRIQKLLEREGVFYSRSYIGRLMSKMGLRSILKKKFVVTTDSKHDYPIASNLLNRDFDCGRLGEKWVSDITYIKVGKQWNYLTVIIDLADRKVVGWSLSEDMKTENTTYQAWIVARQVREIGKEFIFHSDRGMQYAAYKMTNLFCFNRKIRQSMSRKGNCWDNAVAESFFKSIKYEWINRHQYECYEQAYDSIQQYINWYNNHRLHSALGYLTPLEKEIQLRKLINQKAA